MNKIKCLIADDEELSLDLLESYIQQVDKLQLISKCKNGIEVFNAIKNNSLDLLFLDIQMPQLTGIELIKIIQQMPKVVFTTAFREFALDGYELNVLDYLLKPVSFERFLKAVDKYESSVGNSLLHTQKQQISQPDFSAAFIYVKAEKKMIKIFLNQIICLEGMKDYVKIKSIEKDIITHQTLNDFEQRLPSTHFVRVHRSFIVAVDKIKAYTASKIEFDKLEIPIGSFYQKDVLKKLSNN
ncbi:MAG: LytR/AlgR family response regulator transcription factor [Chitinophagaceae bacterium]